MEGKKIALLMDMAILAMLVIVVIISSALLNNPSYSLEIIELWVKRLPLTSAGFVSSSVAHLKKESLRFSLLERAVFFSLGNRLVNKI